MMSLTIEGRVWIFPDDVNTDDIDPAFGRLESFEQPRENILHIHPEFTRCNQTGDIIVAGKNFGCGSSRETAPRNLIKLGIGCVVAESFARIFFRNCIALALPVMPAQGVLNMFTEGDELQLSFEKAQITNLTTGQLFQGPPLTNDIIQIVKNGGILNLLKSEFSPAS